MHCVTIVYKEYCTVARLSKLGPLRQWQVYKVRNSPFIQPVRMIRWVG